MGPKCSQEVENGAKMGQDGAKMSQDEAKMAEHGPQMAENPLERGHGGGRARPGGRGKIL